MFVQCELNPKLLEQSTFEESKRESEGEAKREKKKTIDPEIEDTNEENTNKSSETYFFAL